MATSKAGGESVSDSDLRLLPSLKHDASFAPKMLTPSEIDWLRRHNKAVYARLRQLRAEQERKAGG